MALVKPAEVMETVVKPMVVPAQVVVNSQAGKCFFPVDNRSGEMSLPRFVLFMV